MVQNKNTENPTNPNNNKTTNKNKTKKTKQMKRNKQSKKKYTTTQNQHTFVCENMFLLFTRTEPGYSQILQQGKAHQKKGKQNKTKKQHRCNPTVTL